MGVPLHQAQDNRAQGPFARFLSYSDNDSAKAGSKTLEAITMKKIYPLLLILMTIPVLAQVPDFTVTDCNNTSKSFYDVIASGKVLIIASEGLDCSTCMSKAPGIQNFAAQNSGTMEVWGAMTFLYKSDTPDCAGVNQWVSTYSWNNIFAFIDSARTWFMSGTPRYYVYDPRDSSLAYEGFSESTAFQTATGLVNSMGAKENKLGDFTVNAANGYLEFQNAPSGYINVQVVSLTGKPVKAGRVASGQRILVADLVPGIYLVSVKNTTGFQAVRKIYIE